MQRDREHRRIPERVASSAQSTEAIRDDEFVAWVNHDSRGNSTVCSSTTNELTVSSKIIIRRGQIIYRQRNSEFLT